MFYDDEIINWDFERSQPVDDKGAVTGHFTQIVWRSSMQMTFAYAYDPSKQRFAFVFNFLPPGNVWGNYAMNVGNLKKTPQPNIPPPPTAPMQYVYPPTDYYLPPVGGTLPPTNFPTMPECLRCCKCMVMGRGEGSTCNITLGRF
jgi:hypothetical protein